MEALQVSSERFTLKTGITGVKLPGPLSSLLASASGELTTSPPAGNVIFDELGQSLTLRMLGETAYLYVPSISSEDGQRPWVDLGRSPFKELLTPSAKLGGTARPAAPQSPFAGELKLIREASAIREIGPASVDGQEVTRFTAAFNPAKIEKAPRTAAIKTARGRHVAQVPPVKRAGKLELFIAPTGLPVRTVVAITTSGPGGSKRERVTDTVTVDVLAINFPLVVEAPPAAETIALAQLEALERKHARKHRRTRSAKRARPRD